MKKQSLKAKEQIEAVEELRELVKPGAVVYTVLRHVSRSGMSRAIDLYIIDQNHYTGKPGLRRITYAVSKALDYKYSDNHDALIVGGCGMDMGFSVVYNLGGVLYPEGWTREEGGSYGRHTAQVGEHDKDGGYSLRQEWL